MLTQIERLDLSGIVLTPDCCSNVGQLVRDSSTIKALNLQYCKISNQGFRSILKGLDKNTTMQDVNFSYNNMHSGSYEFSSLMGKIISRHPSLMHVDLTCANLKVYFNISTLSLERRSAFSVCISKLLWSATQHSFVWQPVQFLWETIHKILAESEGYRVV